MQMFRSNSCRTGHYVTRGVRRLSGVKWIHRSQTWIISSPVVVPGPLGIVCFGDGGGKMCALNAASGRELWSFWTDGEIVCSPAVESGIVLFGSYDSSLYAVGLSTGELFWRFRTGNSILSSPIAVSGTGFGQEQTGQSGLSSIEIVFAGIDGFLYRLDAFGREISRMTVGPPVVSSPALTGYEYSDTPSGKSLPGTIAVIGDEDGVIRALVPKTGNELWHLRTMGSVQATPALANGSVYVGSSDGYFYCLDILTGTERWKFKARDGIKSSAAVFDNLVLFGGLDSNVYALDAELGYLRWKFPCLGRVESSPSIAEGTVYFGSDDGNMYAVDTHTGRELWRFCTDGPIRSSPAVCDGVVYLAGTDGNIYAIH